MLLILLAAKVWRIVSEKKKYRNKNRSSLRMYPKSISSAPLRGTKPQKKQTKQKRLSRSTLKRYSRLRDDKLK
jgi:hypothetical protein